MLFWGWLRPFQEIARPSTWENKRISQQFFGVFAYSCIILLTKMNKFMDDQETCAGLCPMNFHIVSRPYYLVLYSIIQQNSLSARWGK